MQNRGNDKDNNARKVLILYRKEYARSHIKQAFHPLYRSVETIYNSSLKQVVSANLHNTLRTFRDDHIGRFVGFIDQGETT